MSEIDKTDCPNPMEALGKMLSEERVKQNLSIADVSAYLKLSNQQIRLIEAGDIEKLPAPVFLRGFIRNYARYLDIHDDILPLLNQALPSSTQKETHHSFNSHCLTSKSSQALRVPRWLWVIILILVVAGGIYRWQQKSAAQNQQQVSHEIEKMGVNNASHPKIDNENVMVVPLEEKTTDDSAQEKQDTSSDQEAAQQEEAAAKEAVLDISIRYRSKLTISDADGKVLIDQIVPGGSDHQFTGKPPYQVKIGYATGSVVTYGDKVYDIAPYTHDKTAILTIPATP